MRGKIGNRQANNLYFNPRIFKLAPGLSKPDIAILLAALTTGDRALEAFHYWRDQLEWDKITPNWQRLLPLLHENLTRMDVKDPLLDRIKGVRRFKWAQNLRTIALAKTVYAELSRAGIPALLLKGTSLIASGYAHRSIRPMDDIDILIPPEQMPAAIETLEKLDIRPRFIPPASLINRLVPERILSGWPFANSVNQEVDIHWNAMHLDRRLDSDRDAWLNSRIVDFEGSQVRVMDPAYQFINICAHGARDPDQGFIRWIADAVLVVRQSSELKWDEVVSVAGRHGLSAVMARTLDLLATLFDLSIDPKAIARLRAQSTWYERVEMRLLGKPPSQVGVSGVFLKVQQFRRTEAAQFDAPFFKSVLDYLIATTGTRGIFAALSRKIYFSLDMPRYLRSFLGPDFRLRCAPLQPTSPVADINFVDGNYSEAMFLNGWSIGERSGRWTDGRSATIALRLDEPTYQLPTLSFEVSPATTHDHHPRLEITVFVNDRVAIEREFIWGEDAKQTLVYRPPPSAKPTSLMLVTFEIRNPRQPPNADGAADLRHLGIFLSRLKLTH
jgi:hypothetical protein